MADKTLTKQELKEKQRRRAARERKRMLVDQKEAAMSNLRNRASLLAGDFDDDDYPQSGSDFQSYGGQGVDHRFAPDVQNAKFCRKPVGFLMSLIFLVIIALVALPFIPISLPSAVGQYTSLFAETEPKAAAVDESEGEEEGDEENASDDETAAEAAAYADDAEATDGTGTDTTDGSDAGSDDEAEEGEEAATGTYYGFDDPVYGWIRFVMGKLNLNVDLPFGESPWYDAQVSKVETGMEDTLAPILLEVFPAAIILYVLFALAMFIKTFICWASGDRRIYRHTWVECLIMLILGLVVALGGFASTVEMTGTMDFGGIVNFLAGLITGAGGFTAGFGLLAMVALPLVELILSFFLLEKKLRSRDIAQPIIMYDNRK